MGHLLRSNYDCIISTSQSINKDNSLLNCRIEGLNNNKPDLVIIDRNLKIKKNLKLFGLLDKRKTYIVTTNNNKDKIQYLRKRKIQVIKLIQLNNKNYFNIFFKKLFKIGKGRILIETGLILLKKLIKFNFINNLYMFKSNELLKAKGFNNCNNIFIKKLKLKKNINVNLQSDKLYKIRIK